MSEPTTTEPPVDPTSLSLLEDIVVPEAVSWWPLAPAWWVLIGAALLVGVLFGWRVFRRWKADAYRRQALRELEAMGDEPAGVPALLKRVALAVWPRTEIAGLSGERWIAFLRESSSGGFDDRAAEALLQLSYRAGDLEQDKSIPLIRSAEKWIATHQPPNS